MSGLLLLTNRYPYSPGEEYLHTEVPFLSERFDQVLVAPTMPSSQEKHGRALPENTRVIRGRVRHGHVTRARLALRGLRAPRDWVTGETLTQKTFDRYFYARTQYVADSLEPLVREHLENPENDITAIYAYWFYITTSVADELRRRIPSLRSVPIVARGHGYDVNESASPINYLPARARMLDTIDYLHPTADTITHRMQAEWPAYAEKISTRRLGVTLAGQPSNREVGRTINVLSCSSLSPLKRIPLMAQTVAHLSSRGHNITWTHLGSGSSRQVKELEQLVQRLGISNSVDLAGQVSNDEVYARLRTGKYHVFLNTSSSESVSFSMSEALGAGLPVVATDVVGTHEIIETGVNGVLLGSNPTPEEVGSGLLQVVEQSPELYKVMQAEAVSTCVRHFDPSTVYARFADELLRLASDNA